jgi:two-component system response regulator VicR
MLSNGSPDRVLIIDDETAIVDVLSTYLRDEGFEVLQAFDGADGLACALRERPALVILDVNLPKLHGSEVFRRMRDAYDVPIIMLTSRSTEIDRVVGLELGADDYIAKPFSPREVVARVKTVLRRSRSRPDEAGAQQKANVQVIGTLEIDRGAHVVRRRGSGIPLTPTEFRILDALARNLGQVLTREQLIDKTSRDGDIFDRTLDRHVANLRHKIEDDPAHPTCVLTVHAVGYKMVEPAR